MTPPQQPPSRRRPSPPPDLPPASGGGSDELVAGHNSMARPLPPKPGGGQEGGYAVDAFAASTGTGGSTTRIGSIRSTPDFFSFRT